jgi:hypothetical protein
MKGGGEIERWFVSTEKRKIDWEKHKGVAKRRDAIMFPRREEILCCNPVFLNFHCFNLIR